jgi:hypothetical protein
LKIKELVKVLQCCCNLQTAHFNSMFSLNLMGKLSVLLFTFLRTWYERRSAAQCGDKY